MTIWRIVGNSSPARHLSNRAALRPNFSNKRDPSVKQGFSEVSVMVGAFNGHVHICSKRCCHRQHLFELDVVGVHISTERKCGDKCKGNFKETIITMVIPKRMTAKMEGSFCVFLIGMRINRSWKMHKWLPVFLAMPRRLTELRRQPDLGFIGGHVWF